MMRGRNVNQERHRIITDDRRHLCVTFVLSPLSTLQCSVTAPYTMDFSMSSQVNNHLFYR